MYHIISANDCHTGMEYLIILCHATFMVAVKLSGGLIATISYYSCTSMTNTHVLYSNYWKPFILR